MKRERLLNIPNGITCLRICLICVFFVVHFAYPRLRRLSIGLFVAAGFTDFLDGAVARKLGQITWLGKLLDPLADKLMILSALICLMYSDVVPAWILGLVLIKEIYMIAGGTLLFRRQIVIASDLPGKAATFLFVPAVILIYPWHDVAMLRNVGRFVLYASLIMSGWAAVHYTLIAVKKSDRVKTD